MNIDVINSIIVTYYNQGYQHVKRQCIFYRIDFQLNKETVLYNMKKQESDENRISYYT